MKANRNHLDKHRISRPADDCRRFSRMLRHSESSREMHTLTTPGARRCGLAVQADEPDQEKRKKAQMAMEISSEEIFLQVSAPMSWMRRAATGVLSQRAAHATHPLWNGIPLGHKATKKYLTK